MEYGTDAYQRNGVSIIEKSLQDTRLEQIADERERSERRYRYYDQQVKILKNSMKTMTRKERTHRLCTRGGMLESFLVMPGDLTDEQIMEILKVAFRQQTVRVALDAMLADVREAKDNLEKMLEDPIE